MKLYDVPRNTHIRIPDLGSTLLFHRIDGMYSYCTDEDGTVYHLSAFAEVEPLEQISNS